MRVGENTYFASTLEAKTLIPSTGCISNSHVREDAKFSHTKMEHQHRCCYGQDSNETVRDDEGILHVVYGKTGTVLSFEAGVTIACTGTPTVEVDLLKNGTTILTAAISIDNANAAYTPVAGIIAITALIDGDVLGYKIISKGADGEDVEKVEEFLADVGDTLPDPWGVDAETVNSTEDYVADAPDGIYTLTHDNTAEAQAMQLFWTNQLMIDLFERPVIRWLVKLDLTGANQLGSADQRVVIGVCNDHTNAEDALDATTVNAWFRIEGADSKIYVEVDDGTTNTDDQDSGVTIVDNAWTEFEMDFSNLSDVKFSVNGVEQSGAAMDMSAIVASVVVQPIVCIQRDGGAEEEKVYIGRFKYTSGRYLGTQAKGIFVSLGLVEDAQ